MLSALRQRLRAVARGDGGMSLIELLVAMVLSTLVGAMTLMTFISASSASSATGDRLLGTLLRSHQERAALAQRMSAHERARGRSGLANQLARRADDIDANVRARLDREAPTHFEAPTGSLLPIDYEAEQGPTIAVRLQELFGLKAHPAIAGGRVPLVLELLSPAQRPVQVTRDLPGFWRGSYAAVRSDLRGRYPRHPWPEDPANALPTRRVKPRGT